MAASRQFSSEGGIGDKQTQIRGWSILDAEPEGGFRVQGRSLSWSGACQYFLPNQGQVLSGAEDASLILSGFCYRNVSK